jgi:O-antigen/teichoic acid export membrane protein
MSTLKQQGTKAFIWDFLGKMATHGMGFVVTIFLARLLEPSDFGLVAMIMVVISIATVFSDVGLGAALIQRRRVLPAHYSSVFYFNIFVGLLLTLVTFFAASWVSEFYNNAALLLITQVMSLSFIISAFSSVQNTKLRKELNYALLTKVGLISSFLSGVIGISLALWGAGVWSLVVQLLSMGIIYNIVIWFSTLWRPSLTFSWKALTQLWGFGFRMFLSGLIEAVFQKLDFLIIGKLFPVATLGYFQRAKSLNGMVIQYSSGSLMAVLFPILSKVQNDLPRFQNIVLKALGIISFIVFLLIGLLYLVSEELIILLFSEKWLPSVDMFKILIMSGFAYPISALLVNILSSRGNSKAFLRLQIYKKLIVAINFTVLYMYGIYMFLYGMIIQSTLGVTLNILFASQEIKLPFYKFAMPILTQASIAFISVVLTIFITQNIDTEAIIIFIVKGSCFTFLYFLLNYIIKTSSYKYFLEQLTPIRKKLGPKMKNLLKYH